MKIKLFELLAVVIIFILVIGYLNSSNSSDVIIRVGSKDFTESMIVAEIYALALEDAGIKVERVPAFASSLIIHQAMVDNQIDVYPEYTGTGLLTILQRDLITDPIEVYNTVKSEYAKQFQITWLDLTSANDGQGIVIRTDVSKKYRIKTISDLQKYAAELRFCSQGHFDWRADGLPGLEAIYGPFDWKSSRVYDNGIKYDVLSSNEADAAPAYTTEGSLVNTDLFTLLEDDKHAWPPYNLVPIVQFDALDAAPGIARALNNVGIRLDTAALTSLNAQVDLDKRDIEKVASDFYKSAS